MEAMQNDEVTLADVMVSGTTSSLFSWQHLKQAYGDYIVANPLAAICLVAYVIISISIIVFLLQPKAARTWRRPRRQADETRPRGAPAVADELADLYGTPIVHGTQTGSHLRTAPDKPARPLVHQGPGPSLPAGKPVQSGSSLTQGAAILYVTDSASSDHFVDSLGAAGLAVISCQPGREAVHHVAVSRFDLIVIDATAAEIARLAATRLLEVLPSRPPMPMLIIANSPSQTLNLAATNARIDYLFRPFDDAFLVTRVNLMLAGGKEPAEQPASSQSDTAAPYDRQMEKLVDELPAVVDEIQRKSEQQSLNDIELQSGIIAALGEDAAKSLGTPAGQSETPLVEEIQKTTDKVDELLRLCATIKPPKPQK